MENGKTKIKLKKIKREKQVHVSFLLLQKEVSSPGAKTHIVSQFSKSELIKIISSIRSLPIDIDSSESRYLGGKDQDARCIFFQDDDINFRMPKIEGFISGIFIKRRNSGFPYEEDGVGTLIELKLRNQENVIAEATYFLLNLETQVLIWQNNRFVSGFKGFADYITSKYIQICEAQIDHENEDKYSPLSINKRKAHIEPYQLINAAALTEFSNKMASISQMELRIAGFTEDLEKFTPKQNGLENELKALIATNGRINGANVLLRFTADRDDTLDKGIINNLFRILKKSFPHTTKKLQVKGTIDDQTRVIDLFEDKLIYTQNVEVSGRYIKPNSIFDILKDAYLNYFPRIKDQLNEITKN